MTEAIAGPAAPPRPADRGNPMLDPLLERLARLAQPRLERIYAREAPRRRSA